LLISIAGAATPGVYAIAKSSGVSNGLPGIVDVLPALPALWYSSALLLKKSSISFYYSNNCAAILFACLCRFGLKMYLRGIII
jgi:hypothetical protein